MRMENREEVLRMVSAVGKKNLMTKSPKETQHLGTLLGNGLNGGEVIGLIGDLGSGKTCFVQGLAIGLGLSAQEISSPTFTLIHEHKGRKRFAHVDLYRLEQVEAAESLGLVDYFDGEGVTVIEWAERALTLLPSEKLLIEFKIQSKDERTLQIEALGESYHSLVDRWVRRYQSGRNQGNP